MNPTFTTQHPTAAALSTWMLLGCLAAVYIIWGTTYFAIKVAVAGMPPLWLIGTRFTAAGLLLLGWQRLRRQPLPTARQWPRAGLIGMLLLVGGVGSVTIAERWVSSGAAVALISVMPLAAALWSGLLGQWPRRLEWVAILLGAVGAGLMLMGRDLQATAPGTALILFGVCCWSFGSVFSRRIDAPHGASGFAAEMLVAGVFALSVSVAIGEHPRSIPSASALGAWLYLVVFGSIVAFSAYRYLVERVSATLATTYAYVNAPVGLLVGAWLGHERFSPQLLLGLPIVLGAVALHAWVQTYLASHPAPRATTVLARAEEAK